MFSLEFMTHNAAFDNLDYFAESARILREIADKIESGHSGKHKVMDGNGNAVGDWFLTPADERDEDYHRK